MCNVVADNSHLYCVTSTYQLLRPSLYINPLAPEFVIFSETISPLLLDDMFKQHEMACEEFWMTCLGFMAEEKQLELCMYAYDT